MVHVTVNGEEIVCTNEHPFYSPVKGWTAACQLRAGDILVLVNGEYVVVEQVQHELLESPIATYNFEVQDFHTYYVGESAVLVHNLCTSTSTNYRSNAKQFYGTDGAGQQAHHIFPQKFEAYFNSKGMNIHSPQNITFMDRTVHLKGSSAYNKLWATFISENPDASYNTIKIAGQMFMKIVF